MAFPAEHFGALKKRVWYKVRWARSPPGERVEGKFDLLMADACERYKGFLEVLERIEVEECEAGLPVGFGKSESKVDEWIRKNRKA